MTNPSRPRARAHQRGVTLVEALVAFLVMAFGMLAIIGVQATLRFNGDIAKQRSEAVRLAQGEMERRRAFSALVARPDITSYDQITAASWADAALTVRNTDYTIARTLDVNNAWPNMTQLQVDVSWTDRQGAIQTVTMNTSIAAQDPGLSGYLALVANGRPTQDPFGRARGKLPFYVKDLGDGTSAYKPPNSTTAWVFDNTSGLVTRMCTVPLSETTPTLTGTTLVDCVDVAGFVVSGYVRFAQNSAATTADAEHPTAPALDLAMTLLPSADSPSTSSSCFDEQRLSPFGDAETDVFYACVVVVGSTVQPKQWGGRVSIFTAGTFGTTAGTYRLCRYSADYNNNGSIGNEEHPENYVAVAKNLSNQNFLLIDGAHDCPTDGTPVPINSSTVQMEPPL